MGGLASAVVLVGIAIAFIGGIMFIIAAFNESALWGLGVLFVAPISLIFLVLHWRQAKDGFLTQLLGYGIVILGAMMGNTWLVTV